MASTCYGTDLLATCVRSKDGPLRPVGLGRGASVDGHRSASAFLRLLVAHEGGVLLASLACDDQLRLLAAHAGQLAGATAGRRAVAADPWWRSPDPRWANWAKLEQITNPAGHGEGPRSQQSGQPELGGHLPKSPTPGSRSPRFGKPGLGMLGNLGRNLGWQLREPKPWERREVGNGPLGWAAI